MNPARWCRRNFAESCSCPYCVREKERQEAAEHEED